MIYISKSTKWLAISQPFYLLKTIHCAFQLIMSKANPKELFYKQFGARLKKIRLEKKLSIREVELRGDIDRSILSKIENGSRNCTIYTLKKIADAMEVDLTEFFRDLD